MATRLELEGATGCFHCGCLADWTVGVRARSCLQHIEALQHEDQAVEQVQLKPGASGLRDALVIVIAAETRVECTI